MKKITESKTGIEHRQLRELHANRTVEIVGVISMGYNNAKYCSWLKEKKRIVVQIVRDSLRNRFRSEYNHTIKQTE